MKEQKKTLKFQAEITQLLDLVARSLYNNKDVFLRELISNASDALDKLRFSALLKNELYEDDSHLKIQIKVDKENSQLMVTDNGIGMTREEVIENLGMIAKSGTREFLSKLKIDKSTDLNLIGQFGVGFYSAFMVADKVIVKTRKAGSSHDEGTCWESAGTGEYTLQNINKPQRGTEVILHLKKEDQDYLNNLKLKNIITKYSDHIPWPIVMGKSLDLKNDSKEKDADTFKATEEEIVNCATALWTLPKNKIKEEQYIEFYKHLSHDFYNPLAWSHNHIEGKQHYISLLFIPAKASYDLWNPKAQYGLKLYINRVFILEEADQFLPRYLRFMKGIIDSSDLPINVSREFLQNSSLVESIKKSCTQKVLNLLENMAENEKENYAKFWSEFGLTLKEGLIEDYENKTHLANLLRFSTTRTDDETQETSFKEYLARKLKNQEKIYYAFGKNFEVVKNIPHLGIFKEKEIEVILLYDRIDEWLISSLTEFEGIKLESVTSNSLNIDRIENKEKDEKKEDKQEKTEQAYASFFEKVKEVLKDKIKDVKASQRLTDFPACFVTDTTHPNFPGSSGMGVFEAKPIFELNMKHPLINKIKEDTNSAHFKEWIQILYDHATLIEGKNLTNSAQHVQDINTLFLGLLSKEKKDKNKK